MSKLNLRLLLIIGTSRNGNYLLLSTEYLCEFYAGKLVLFENEVFCFPVGVKYCEYVIYVPEPNAWKVFKYNSNIIFNILYNLGIVGFDTFNLNFIMGL